MTSADLKQLARKAGFDLCGITDPGQLPDARRRFDDWLTRGFQADMNWLNTSRDRRVDPASLIDDVQSVIILGVNYYQLNSQPVPEGYGRISRYARGRDYHKVLSKMCKQLIQLLESEISRDNDRATQPVFKFWVDFGPFMERAYAVKAGLGNIGKNGMLINRRYGSWMFLAEIVTDLKLEIDHIWSGEHGRCGTCRRCIEACPTGAIIEEGVVDSNKCLSYWTIERSDPMPEEQARAMGSTLFGCDICQEVCPRNSESIPTENEQLMSVSGLGEFISLDDIDKLETDKQFISLTAGTSLTRPKLSGLKRNAVSIRNNSRSNNI